MENSDIIRRIKRKQWKRIYIIGAVGSGKTTLARQLSEDLGISWVELDNVYHHRFPGGSRPKEPAIREAEFSGILNQESWIIEGVRRKCFDQGFELADGIIFLDTHPLRRSRQITKRWIFQRIRLERANYNPTVGMFVKLHRWSLDFEKKRRELYEVLENYAWKVLIKKQSFYEKRIISGRREEWQSD